MSFEGIKLVKKYRPVYYSEMESWTGNFHGSKEEAEEEIKDLAYASVYDRADDFHHAKIETFYVSEEIWVD